LTIVTGISVTITRPDITAGQPERGPTWPLVSREIIPVLKEALVELTLGRCPLRTRVLVVEIAGVLILWLDVLHVHDTYVI
jgi:hypothetical protein